MQEKRLSASQFVRVTLQLSLLLLVIRQFQIESPAFLRLMLLAYGGFLVHAVLPLCYRLPFFVFLSLGGIALVFGIPDSLWLVGIGLVLIGLCHLPVPLTVRVGLLLVVGGGLAVLRVDWVQVPWSQALWPILASMFMFRLIVYLYDRNHETEPASPWRTLAYFFLLPNVCFPLFPVVDYKTFRRTYYEGDPYQIYQTGVQWMTRGVIHLLLYRLVYYHVTLSPTEVVTAGDLLRYLLANFFLYLRVSGQFHLIVGMLHLFGFQLPETHRQYYLATSFTDYWRRINIYWKDFMLKVFYYPAFFQLRSLGGTKALVISTLFVFLMTWLLHAYQWFWLRGSFLLTGPDIIFWSVLALLVMVNSLYEAKYGRERALGKNVWDWRSSVLRVFAVIGTFCILCILWSLWTCESLSEWVSLWASVRNTAAADVALLLLLFMVGVIVVRSAGGYRRPRQGKWALNNVSLNLAALCFLLLFGVPEIYVRLGSSAATVIHSLRAGNLNRLDTARLERGYYEELLGVDRFNSQLWEVYSKRPLDWLETQNAGLARPTGDFLQRELIPLNTSFASRVTVHTNRWGMRDRDYEKQPTPHTYRIALLGSSPVMGLGVEDYETFESLLEGDLNRKHSGDSYAKYEILNFGVSNYQPLQQRVVLEKALSFSPNTILYIAHDGEKARAARYLAEVIRKRINVPYESLREIAQRANIDTETTEAIATRRLKPFQEEILSWLYHSIVDACRSRGVQPVWLQLPLPMKQQFVVQNENNLEYAKAAGFLIIDLSGVYADQDVSTLQLTEWDSHPNAKAHRLIATKLYNALQEKNAELSLGLSRRELISANGEQTLSGRP